MLLKDKSVVVTGSTSGIGLAIARAFAAEGANICLNGLGDVDEIESLRRVLENDYSIKAIYSPADMRSAEQIAAMISLAEKQFGSVDILVNNAGIQHVAPIEDFAPDKWDQVLAINLTSAFHTIRSALPLMKSKGRGRVINIASAHGLVASPYKSAYVTAKHGMIGLTKTVALEIAKENITCNAICPGYVLTPLVDSQIDAQAKVHQLSRDEVINKVILEKQPSKAFVTVDEVATLCVYLASDAAKSINGAALSMDGGWSAQ